MTTEKSNIEKESMASYYAGDYSSLQDLINELKQEIEQTLPNQILHLADGLKTLACSIKNDGYPPEAQRVCRIGSKIVTYYLQLKKQEIDTAVEMAKFHAGFKWTALKEENMRNEFWLDCEK